MNLIFVNNEKYTRAKEIVGLITNEVAPKNEYELERKETFTMFLKKEKLDPKTPEALEWIYRKMGGLVRTEEEEQEFKKKVEESKKKKTVR